MSRRLLLWVAVTTALFSPPPASAQSYLEAVPSWFSPASDYNGVTALGDVNSDGLLDLVVASDTRPTRLYLNIGAGFFSSSPAWTGPTGQTTNNLAIGDVDGDGRLDLVCVNQGQPITLHRNRGGTFSVTPDWSSGSSEPLSGAALGDVNGDGLLDLVVGRVLGQLKLYLNRGGTFTVNPPDWESRFAYEVTALALGDVDDDGDLDLVCGGRATGGTYETPLMLFPNDGGLLSRDPTWSSGPGDRVTRICLGDVNGDGLLDIVAGSIYTPDRLFLNQGGSFGAAPDWTSPSAERTRGVALGDVDGDGVLDLVCGNATVMSHMYLGDGTTFANSSAWSPAFADSTERATLADIDSDGDLDLLVGNRSRPVRLYLNLGGRFGPARAWTSGPETPRATCVGIGDVNRDGYLDMVFGNSPGGLTLYLNRGGTWAATPDWIGGPSMEIKGVALGDVNGDGWSDLVYTKAQSISGSGEVGMFLNKSGTFGPVRDWFSSAAYDPRAVVLGDVTGDGRLDLVCGMSGSPIYLYVNNNGTFPKASTWQSTGTTGDCRGLSLSDVDGDGDLDLMGSIYPRTYGFTNQAGALGVSPGWTSDAWNTVSLAAGDLNGDRSPDLVCGNMGGLGTSVFINQGGRYPASPVFWYTQPTETQGVALGDVDADGDLDLALANNLNEPSSVYLNLEGSLTGFGWQEDAVRHAGAVALADLDDDGDLDLVLAGRDEESRVYSGQLARALPADPTRPARQLAASDAWFRDVRVEKVDIYRYRVRLMAVDVESDPVWVLGEYAVTGGAEWLPITPADGPSSLGPLTSSPQGVAHEFIWDVAPLPTGRNPIALRLRAFSSSRRVSLVQRVPIYFRDVGIIEVNRPALAAALTAPSLPTVTVGDTSAVTLTLRNAGNLPLNVSAVALPDAEMSLAPAPPFTLAPAESVVCTLSFSPTRASTIGASVRVSSDDPLTPEYELPVSAVALGLTVETQALTVGDPTALGEAVTVVSLPAPGVRIERGTLHYRVRGETDFSSRELIERGATWVGVIPGEAVRESGVDYYLEFGNSGVTAVNPTGAPAGALFGLDVQPPEWITATPQPTGRGDFLAGREIPVLITMPLGSEFLDGTLRYRLGGQAAYDSVLLAVSPTLHVPVGIVPAGAVGPRGLEYWVETRTATQALTWPAAEPAAHPDTVRVTVTDLVEPDEHPGGRYRLLSLPLDFSTDFAGSVADLLSDQSGFGTYDPVNWRLYFFDPAQAANVEYSAAGAALFRPLSGRAFWLVSRPAHRVDIAPGRGLSVRTGDDYPIVVAPGWNMIGNPFDFAVAWDSVRRPATVDGPVVFDPALGEVGDYADTLAAWLEPFAGYFVENTSAQPETLWVPPGQAAGPSPGAAATARSGVAAGADSAAGAWSLRLRARTAKTVDGANRLGVHPLAADGRDALDLGKPPAPPGAWVRVAFVQDDGGRVVALRHDLRGAPGAGHVWELEVSASEGGEPVTLDLLPETALPAGLTLKLIDREQQTEAVAGALGTAAPGSPLLSRRLLAFGPGKPYRLTLLAGSAEFVAGEGATEPPPGRVQLDPTAPNPFRTATRVRFGLPVAGPARLDIFGLRGERVATLLDGTVLPPGYHTYVWDGTAAGGARAASGVYYLRLEAAGTTLTRRVVLIR